MLRCRENICGLGSSHQSAKFQFSVTVLQVAFEGRGVLGRALFVWSYKNEGTMYVSCDMISIKT